MSMKRHGKDIDFVTPFPDSAFLKKILSDHVGTQ